MTNPRIDRNIRVGQAFNLAFSAALLEHPGDIDATLAQAKEYVKPALAALQQIQEELALPEQGGYQPSGPHPAETAQSAYPAPQGNQPPPPPPPPGGFAPAAPAAGGSKKDQRWAAYFANPGEYHDNRLNKRNPNGPDFKHKSNGEALWLGGKFPAPAWVLERLGMQ